MNKKQKIILFTFSVILLAALIFPPFHLNKGEAGDFNTGYSFILIPPEINELSKIDTSALFLEYLFIVTIGSALFFAFKDKQ